MRQNILLALLAISTQVGFAQTKSVEKKGSNSKSKGQSPTIARNASNAYTEAIAQYIAAVYKGGVIRPDTLFIGKNVDMPNIVLPDSIANIKVHLISSESAQRKLTYRKSLVYLNVVGWLEKKTSEFIVVTFFEFKPQHNCKMLFNNTADFRQMDLVSIKWEYPYSKK